jgi:hypothetical protein
MSGSVPLYVSTRLSLARLFLAQAAPWLCCGILFLAAALWVSLLAGALISLVLVILLQYWQQVPAQLGGESLSHEPRKLSDSELLHLNRETIEVQINLLQGQIKQVGSLVLALMEN